MRKHLPYILLAILTLPLLILAQKQVQQFLSKAAPQPANIILDIKNVGNKIEPVWSGFAQGGEEPPPMLSNIVPKLKELSPTYIRIDHIYDSYSVVERTDSGFKYDFSRLDNSVDDIIASGALPFFSLSYMPPVFNNNGSLIEIPSDWNLWKDLVKATIEHYSGKTNKNLNNIYYEIWNEPELPQFGSWKLAADKDYRLLYFYAATGAKEASDVNNYYLGGPSAGSYYPDWVNNFLNYISQNNLRLDFYSWHRYTKNPLQYQSDAKNIRHNLTSFPKYKDIPLILSEWGIDSENSTNNNSSMAAAFSVSTVAKFIDWISLAFVFEIKDGPPPSGGKWGLLTHEKDSNQPLSPKPRFKAFKYLSNLKGIKLYPAGEGTFVSALATLEGSVVRIILTNYDQANKNIENVPVTISGLEPSSYNLSYTFPLEDRAGHQEIITTNGIISQSFLMPANSLLYLELAPSAKLAKFIPGKSGDADDFALMLESSDLPLTLATPEFKLVPAGSIGFDIKPFWSEDNPANFLIFEIPFSTESGIINRLALSKQKIGEDDHLVFSFGKEKEEIQVTSLINHWNDNNWHHLEAGWNSTNLVLTPDDMPTQKQEGSFDLRNGKILTFYPIKAAIDNLFIHLGEEQVISKKFNSRIDQ